ncbi:hypothetical protein EJ04DRAFT_579126 [Polyplosphaeria fusca]|uniref:Gfd2/YDR514C-like C-terminal domain-containing protein n=1 Tax=Polyplosphaeria fusca TaxID=682080 RepID=A0A9P4UZX3_9PLEO|nr:hypothetical protein EJ04DRAFT_579126 [Polyplosphaeria fusca]
MASAARLQRLNKLVQTDLDSLPERLVSALHDQDDHDEQGGVSFEPDSKPPSPTDKQAQTPKAEATPQPQPKPTALEEAKTESKSHPSSKLPMVSTPKLPPSTLSRGDLASPIDAFAPFGAITKYPYKFVNKNLMQEIASGFFDGGKIWTREWDFFYVWDIEPSKPLILVREQQFQALLDEINSTLKLNLKVTDQQREDGLVGRFPNHPLLLPRYLGRSTSREEHDKMVSTAPSRTFRPAGETSSPGTTDRDSLEAFRKMMEDMWDVQAKKGKAQKAKKLEDRIAKQQTMNRMFKRCQRYLGLRPTAPATPSPPAPAIDPSLPSPFPFDQSPIFVCVDVESYERAHHLITEVGIATLDTHDLLTLAPGPDGLNWRAQITARHFLIRENMHLVNSQFISGCPDRFEFGTSEVISQADAPGYISNLFHPGNGDRPIILLGHDPHSDIRYLQSLNFNPLPLPHLLEIIDTATLYRVWRREQNPTSLGKILYDFDVVAWHLHNAGNDAVYTVQAMLAVCVREAAIRGTAELKIVREEQRKGREEDLQSEALVRAREEALGWSEGEEGDDGKRPKPVEQKKKVKNGGEVSMGGIVPVLRHEARSAGRARDAQRGLRDRSMGGIYERGEAVAGSYVRASQRGGHARGRGRGWGRGRGGRGGIDVGGGSTSRVEEWDGTVEGWHLPS